LSHYDARITWMVEHDSGKLKASFRLATKEDSYLPTYDNTKLVAMNTCPVYGVVRYQMHKRMPTTGRAMALECGSAMHEVFAFVRLCTLIEQHRDKPQDWAHDAITHHGLRLFGAERLHAILNAMREADDDDISGAAKRGAICVLDTSGFYDDPRDRRRTLANMEEAAFAYIDRWRWNDKVWMREPDDPHSDVGIEWPFDMVIELPERTFRHTGRIDGIHYRGDNLILHENKTASRLNDAWEMSFATSSQVTAYCVAASLYTQSVVSGADIIGLAIPLPKSYDYGGLVRTNASRESFHYERWLSWLNTTVAMYEQYENNPYEAPMYTHSCNRYFRPCSLIPFCDSDTDEQHRTIDEMINDEWSPLDDSHEASADS